MWHGGGGGGVVVVVWCGVVVVGCGCGVCVRACVSGDSLPQPRCLPVPRVLQMAPLSLSVSLSSLSHSLSSALFNVSVTSIYCICHTRKRHLV